MDERRGIWGANLPAFQERLGNEAVKERIENLYFAYLFVLRAILKAGPYLESVSYDTGMPEEDSRTSALIQQLVQQLPLYSVQAVETSSTVDSGDRGALSPTEIVPPRAHSRLSKSFL